LVTAKGQVTLRRDLLEHLGVHSGEKIAVEKLPEGPIEVKAARPGGKISDAFDFLRRKGGKGGKGVARVARLYRSRR
jgi:hypothetical protein